MFATRCLRTPAALPAALLASALFLTAPAVAHAQVLINEIDYDQPSTDAAEFIELKNTGAGPVELGGYNLRLVNGANNTVYATYNLPPVVPGPGEYFVVCGNAATVPSCNHDVLPDSNLIQNGNLDAVALLAVATRTVPPGRPRGRKP